MVLTSKYITYYSSSVGILEIKTDEEAVNAILFVHTQKGSYEISAMSYEP